MVERAIAFNQHKVVQPKVRCAIYTRKSTDENLDSDFNSLDAQRESAENFIKAQINQGWVALQDRYDDGAYSGGNLERPALKRLMRDIDAGKVDTIIVYKIDRLSRSLLDFAKLIEVFEEKNVSLVAVTQQINTSDSSGRLMLNILLSFAQFEREVITERIRDKVAAAKRHGKWMGGTPPLGYDIDREKKKLIVNTDEAVKVRWIFRRYVILGSTLTLTKELNERGWTTKSWRTVRGKERKGTIWNKGHIYRMLNNPLYIGLVRHKDKTFPGEHDAIIEKSLWDEAHAILHDNDPGNRNRSKGETHSMLKGLIRCGHCDASMGVTSTRKKGRMYRYYLCVKADKYGYDSCPVRSLPAAEIEDAVLTQLRGVLKSPEIVAQVYRLGKYLEEEERKALGNEKAGYEQELEELRTSTSQMLQARLDEGKDISFIQEELARLDDRTQTLQRKLALAKATLLQWESAEFTTTDVLNELTTLDQVWAELFPKERERIMRLLIEKIVVYEDALEIVLKTDGLQTLNAELSETGDENGHAHTD